jgi:F-type H+-transporting ATPase subunit gamma
MTAQRPVDLRNRIRSLAELRDVVGAMRSLSAVRVQQAQEMLVAIRQYTAVVESALSESAPRQIASSERTVRDEGDTPRTTTVVAFGSEHGFVGAFNDHVLARASAEISAPRDRLLVVGSRGAMIAGERRHPVAWTCPMASHVGGVDEVALRIAEETGRGGEGLTQVVLVYTRCTGGAGGSLEAEALLPIPRGPRLAPRRDRPSPVSNLASNDLFDALVGELVFARLTHAAMESFASESAARLAAMKSAHDNIEDKLAALVGLEREGRQEEITTELLDVITGVEAMR